MSQLISDAYRALNTQLHENPKFGTGGATYKTHFSDYIKQNGWMTVLDYGAGKQGLTSALRELLPGIRVDAYDPAFPAIATVELDAYDFVICKDVIEHIEPDHLDAVLQDIAGRTGRRAYLLISIKPAVKVLPDGRNAHLLVESTPWWTRKLCEFFDVADVKGTADYAEFNLDPKGANAPFLAPLEVPDT